MKNRVNISEWVDAYIYEKLNYNVEVDGNGWATELFFDLCDDEPIICLNAIIAITKKTNSSKVLGMLAAGPLEDVVESNGETVVDKIKKEAKINHNFQLLLEYMWHSGSDEVWSEIMKLRKNPDIHADMESSYIDHDEIIKFMKGF